MSEKKISNTPVSDPIGRIADGAAEKQCIKSQKSFVRTDRDYTWPAPRYGTLMNIDSDALFHFSNAINWDYTDLDKKVWDYFDKYVDSGIGDIIYNIGGSAPSKVHEWAGEKYLCKKENGVEVDYSESKGMRASYLIYNTVERDPYGVWIERAWESGMRPWISFRMNDVHYANTPTGHSAFFYKAKKNGWMVGDYHHPTSWYGYALDYSVHEVREHFLELIEEQTQTYDAFGIDLDFHRTIRCFKNDDPENKKYMTEFIRRVRAICDAAERKWGHPWRVMIRLCSRVEWAHTYGFDIETYVKERLIDAFVPASYWSSTDSNIPIGEWKRVCGNIPVFWGIECNTVNIWHWVTAETVAGYRLMADAAGADGMYQYNTFGVPWAWRMENAEEALKLPVRRYLTTMNDIPVPLGYKEKEPKYLPLAVSEGKKARITVLLGEIKPTQALKLFVGVKSTEGKTADEAAEALTVTLDGIACAPLGRTGESYMEKYYREKYEEQESGRYPWRIFTFELPADARASVGASAKVEFASSRGTEVCYLEVANGDIE